jgi:hypothetical protein
LCHISWSWRWSWALICTEDGNKTPVAVGDGGPSGGGGKASPSTIPAGRSGCEDGGGAAVDPTIRKCEVGASGTREGRAAAGGEGRSAAAEEMEVRRRPGRGRCGGGRAGTGERLGL